jgi:hypothetical protein
VRAFFQLVYGFAAIAALLAAATAALYACWWVVMLVVRYLPIIGRRHKHADWDRLNGP